MTRTALLSTLVILGTACQVHRSVDVQAGAGSHTTTARQNSTEEKTSMVTSRDGTRIAFDKQGSGPALIIVSGALSNRRLLAGHPLPAKLAEHYTVIVYDRRGRGDSSDVQPYGVAREIEDIEALIAEAGGSAFLYGVSSGAALALQAAASSGPDRIRKLAIYDAPYGQKAEDFDSQKRRVSEIVEGGGAAGDAAAFFLSAIGTPPEALQTMKRGPEWQEMAKMDFTLVYDYHVLGNGAVPEDVVKTIRVPTLVMNGGNSMPFMASAGDRIAELIPQARRETLEGQSHQAEAAVVTPVLIDFFGQ